MTPLTVRQRRRAAGTSCCYAEQGVALARQRGYGIRCYRLGPSSSTLRVTEHTKPPPVPRHSYTGRVTRAPAAGRSDPAPHPSRSDTTPAVVAQLLNK
jgi:hypothetical protein